MSTSPELNYEGVERLALRDFTEKAYLEYSMYVIMDRALPHVGDGLKPVQRRIVYAMSELGLSAASKHKKSARTVGDVLGKFHPHGDSACYEAMVLMAQPFSYRYPLVDGQGNWGSPDDPKSFAAMRYTESRLSKYAKTLLSELGQGTVEWAPNFDGTLKEPEMLPARLPNVLLNGGTGIAVGMATDIPPHNLREVASACIHLLDNPNATLSDVNLHIKGPDYPTDAEIITSPSDIQKMYATGHGAMRMRAIWEDEDGNVVITALPHQVSGSKVIEQVAQQMVAKKLPMVDDLRDESDHESPTRIVVVPRSNRVNKIELMSHLFATTDLERSYRVNLNMIGLDGKPKVKGLLTLLTEWLEFRTTTVRRRLQWRLDKVLSRLHILDGLLVAFLNIDEVIAIIREEDQPAPVLIERFGITDIQAEAILDLKLRHLAKLEEMKLRGEQAELVAERDYLEGILGSDKKLKNLIKTELIADAEEFGDDRRSPLVERDQAKALDPNALMPAEPLTIILSQQGWIRAAKGHDVVASTLNYKNGDNYQASVRGRSNQIAVFLDSTGRGYSVAAHTLPSARGQGEPLSGRVNMPAGATFVEILTGKPDDQFLLSTDFGYGFICRFDDMISRAKAGKALLTVPLGSHVLPPVPIRSLDGQVVATTSDGYLIAVKLEAMPQMARGKGVKIINIPAARLKSGEEHVTAVTVIENGGALKVQAGKKFKTLAGAELSEYEAERGRRGKKLPRGYQKVDQLELFE